MNGYLTYLSSEEYKQHQLDRLIHTTRQIKTLEQQQRAIMFSLVDPEKSNRIYDCVSAVHVGVLGRKSQDEYHQVDEAIVHSLSEEDAIFMIDNKHTRFMRGATVFKQHKDNPIQKKLTREKYMNVTGVKKQKTPSQHIYYMIKAKLAKGKDDRLDRMQQEIDAMKKQVSILTVTQQDVLSTLDSTQSNVEELKEIVSDVEQRIARIEHIVPDKRKQQLYILLTGDTPPSNKSIGDMIGVTERTIRRWRKELEGLCLL